MPHFLSFVSRCVLAAALVVLPELAQAGICPPAQGDDSDLARPKVFRDVSGMMTLEQVSAPARGSAFVPAQGRVATASTRDALWLRFCLPGPQADTDGETRWLRVGPATLGDITLYLPDKDGSYRASRSGNRMPFALREWPYHLFAFSIPPGTDVSRPAYLRVESISSMALRLDLWPESEFRDMVGLDYLFYGVYGGVTLLLFVLSLVAWLWLYDRLYLIYAVNLFAGAALMMSTTGFFSQFLYPDSGTADELVIRWLTGPVLAVYVLFFTYLFAVRRNLPWMYPLLLLLAGLDLLSAPLNLVADWRDIGIGLRVLGVLVGVLGVPLILYLGWKDRERRGYVLAFLPWVVIGFFMSMNRLGWIGGNLVLDYGGELGTLIHLVMLPILLVRRTWKAETEKEQAQNRELQEAHRMERELETRVTLRTDELAKANAMLEGEMRGRVAMQQRLQEALNTERAALAMQRQFVAMLSHECRTPLSIIDTTAQRMEAAHDEGQRADVAQKAGKIRRAVARMLSLLENCLAEERLTASSLILHKEKTDLRDFLAERYGDRDSAMRIRLALPETPQWVECDRHLLDIMLSNLVENALKYSPSSEPVILLLSGEPSGGRILIEVQDRGMGVRAKDRERIFEKFFRSGDSQHIHGAGLGLHLARELARNHGGDVVLGQSGPEQGATFILSLPCAPDADLHTSGGG